MPCFQSATNARALNFQAPSLIFTMTLGPSAKGRDSHHKLLSRYVQLSRLHSLHGVHLLQKIDMKDLQFRPDDRLLAEMERLKKLEQSTLMDEAINWECPKTTICLFVCLFYSLPCCTVFTKCLSVLVSCMMQIYIESGTE